MQQDHHIEGHVCDAQGTPLPGVFVFAVHADTQRLSGAVSDEDGNFAVAELAVGEYVVAAVLAGYLTLREPCVRVPGELRRLRLALEPQLTGTH